MAMWYVQVWTQDKAEADKLAGEGYTIKDWGTGHYEGVTGLLSEDVATSTVADMGGRPITANRHPAVFHNLFADLHRKGVI